MTKWNGRAKMLSSWRTGSRTGTQCQGRRGECLGIDFKAYLHDHNRYIQKCDVTWVDPKVNQGDMTKLTVTLKLSSVSFRFSFPSLELSDSFILVLFCWFHVCFTISGKIVPLDNFSRRICFSSVFLNHF